MYPKIGKQTAALNSYLIFPNKYCIIKPGHFYPEIRRIRTAGPHTTHFGFGKERNMAKFCIKCGAPLAQDDRFCERCGAPIASESEVHPVTRSAAPTFEDSVRMHAGPEAAGVRDVGGTAVKQGTFGPEGWIKGTTATLFGELGNLLAGFFKLFTKPKALLFTVAISAVWIWLNHLRLWEGLEGFTDILSKVTYAGGGTRGSVVQIIGGTLGKGIVGAGLCSILYGGIVKMVRGIGNIFTEPGFHVGAAILGFGCAALTYQFTAGFAGSDGFMVGVAGAMTAFEALSMREGFLVNLAASFSARKITNGKTSGKRLLPGRYKGFLTGTALGFAVWAILCCTGKMDDLTLDVWNFLYDTVSLDVPEGLVPYLLPAALILVGMILNTVGKGKEAA